MTDLIDPQPGQTILEIGTGSGYQAAVLAELVGSVRTIEIIEPLARQATERLKTLGSRPAPATAITAGRKPPLSTPSW
jgi:protein-L-isoaspartate(D-aspartate) O-methyltransferase